LDVPLNAGQSKTVYVYWIANRLPAGEFQGQLVIHGSFNDSLVPYWYGVPNLIPADLVLLNGLPTSAKAGTLVKAFVKVIDFVGYAITDNATLAFQGVATGGGSIALAPTVFFPSIREIDLTLGKTAGNNVFTFAFGKLGPFQIVIPGT